MRFMKLLVPLTIVLSSASPVAQRSRVVDFRELQLQVVRTETVTQIQLSDGSKITPDKPGADRIVVVSLAGTVPANGRFAVSATTFFARWDQVVRSYGAAGQSDDNFLEVTAACAFATNDDSRFTSGQTTTRRVGPGSTETSGPGIRHFDYRQPAPITIRVAFILPKKVSEFAVLFVSAAGDVKVPLPPL